MHRKQIIALLGCLIFLSVSVTLSRSSLTVQAKGKQPKEKENALVVKLVNGTDVKPIIEKFGLKKLGEIKGEENSYLLAPAVSHDLKPLAGAIASQPGVESVEFNTAMGGPLSVLRQPVNFPGDEVIVLGTDPELYRSQPLAAFLQLAAVHSLSQGQGVKVAVIDTGIDMFHPALAGRIAPNGYDFIDEDSIPYDEPGGSNYGHGTFIAALVLLIAPRAQILPLRAMDEHGNGNAFDVGAAIRYAADNGAQVINLSLGTDERPGVVRSAIEYAKKRGCLVTAAMGNSNALANDIYPASEKYVMGVAATDFNDRKAIFSNYGATVAIAAPGVNLVSAFPGSVYARWGGTSFATPLVAGESALLFAARRRDAHNVIDTIVKTAVPINEKGYELGKGRIDPLTALQR